MRNTAGTVRTHVDCVGIDPTIVTLPRALVHTAVLMDEAAQTDFTRKLTRDWFDNSGFSPAKSTLRMPVSPTIVKILISKLQACGYSTRTGVTVIEQV